MNFLFYKYFLVIKRVKFIKASFLLYYMNETLMLKGDQLPSDYQGNDAYILGQLIHRGHPQETYRLKFDEVKGSNERLNPLDYDHNLTFLIFGVNIRFRDEVLKRLIDEIRNKGWTKPPFTNKHELLEAVLQQARKKI